jgi:integrase
VSVAAGTGCLRVRAGLVGIHFHDLRGTGNTYTANQNANLRELMERMGHSTSRAAMIYLHSTDPRQPAIAVAVSEAARTELRSGPRSRKPGKTVKAFGTEVARDSGQSL